MSNKTFQLQLEDAFIEWQLTLKADQQESVSFDHFDYGLQTLFLRRVPMFNRAHLDGLRERLKEIDNLIRVSTIKVPSF